MLTKRCRLPSLTSRAAMPPCLDSRSSITSATVLPFASTAFSPPVWVRRMVRMDTVTAMRMLQVVRSWKGTDEGSGSVRHVVRARVREHVTLDDLDVFLGHHAVHDPERPELVLPDRRRGPFAGGHDHVVDPRVAERPGREIDVDLGGV